MGSNTMAGQTSVVGRRRRRDLWRGLWLVALGVLIAVLALTSDDLGVTFDNNTVDPWQVVGVIVGLVIIAWGIGMVLSMVTSDRSSRRERIVVGAALFPSILGWVTIVAAIPFWVDCDASLGCGTTIGVVGSWQNLVWISLALTAVASWGAWGVWRANGLTVRVSKVLFIVASVILWLVWLAGTIGGGTYQELFAAFS